MRIPEAPQELFSGSEGSSSSDRGEVPPGAVPGRHAARRRAREETGDETGAGGWGPGQVGVVLGGVVLALAVTCLWLLFGTAQDEVTPVAARSEAAPATSSTPAPVSASVSASGSASPTEQGAKGPGDGVVEVVVDVAGKVKRPGLAVLPAGSRVADAVERAGGAQKGVDLTGLNLARVLVDGEQILVGVDPDPSAQTATQPSGGPGAGAKGGSGPVSLNAADEALLDTLPGVGPVTAAAIIAWRTEHGGFSDVRELLEVKGIGEATLADLLPHVTL